VRAAPSTGQAPAAIRGCAVETGCSSQGEAGELQRVAPTFGWEVGRGMPCWQPQAVLVVRDLGARAMLCPRRLFAQHPGTPIPHPYPGLQVPAQLSWLGWL